MSKLIIEILEAAIAKREKQIAKLKEKQEIDYFQDYTDLREKAMKIGEESPKTLKAINDQQSRYNDALFAMNKSNLRWRASIKNISKWFDRQWELEKEVKEIRQALYPYYFKIKIKERRENGETNPTIGS